MGKRKYAIALVWIIGALLLGPVIQPVLAAPETWPTLQEGTFDPQLLDTVARGVAVSAGTFLPNASPPVIVEPSSATAGRRPIPVPTPVPEEEPAPAPEADVPLQPRAEPPEIDLSQRVEYSSGGITFQAPVDWDVTEGVFDSLFDISVPDSEFYAVIQDGGDGFPGLILVILFSSLPDMLLEESMDGGTVTHVESGQTAQQVPMAAAHFDMSIDGLDGSGVIYAFSPGENAYLLSAFALADEWEVLAPGVALMAETIRFDDELLTLVTAEDGDLDYVGESDFLELTLPEGWHVTETDDPDLPLLIADPDYRFAMALGSDTGFDAEQGAEIEGLFDFDGGDLDAETQALVFEMLFEVMEADSGFTIDESLNAVYPLEGAMIFRVVGEGDMGDGLSWPVATYLDLRDEGGLIGLVFGDTAHALELEPELLEIIASTVPLE